MFKLDLKKALLCVVALALLAIGVQAQETTGSIQGTVKDQAGAVVPNVTITIKGVNVGFTRTVQTDGNGVYQARQIPPGVYNVSTTATSGFAAQTMENIQVAIGNVNTVDFALGTSVGAEVNVNVADSGVMIDATDTKRRPIFPSARLMLFRRALVLPAYLRRRSQCGLSHSAASTRSMVQLDQRTAF